MSTTEPAVRLAGLKRSAAPPDDLNQHRKSTAVHWILQDNLINPATRQQLIDLLTVRGVPFTRVTLIPFFHLLEDESPVIEGPVFAYGSTGLGVVAKHQGWAPGYFDANLDYELMLREYGTRALNAGAVCSTIAEMPTMAGQFFIRPTLDNKSFPGSVMTWDAFERFRTGVANVSGDADVTLRLGDRVIARMGGSRLVDLRLHRPYFRTLRAGCSGRRTLC
jgi:hypothetical protein